MPRSARGAAPSRGRLFGGFALLILAALSIALPFHLHHHVDSTTNCPPQLPSDAVQAQHLLQLAQENIDRLNSLANESWADAGAASSAAAVAEPPRVAPTAAALPLATTRPAAAAASSLWLRLVLVSVARKGAPDYLVRSLRSIVESLPSSPSHPMRAATEVVAMNNNEPPDAHRVFHDAERELGNLARFVVKRPARPALDCPKAGKLRGAVQKQTCDLVATFETLLQLQPPSEMLLMLEDDWLLCPNGMLALQVGGAATATTASSTTSTHLNLTCPNGTLAPQHAIEKASRYDPHWLALRVSYGFNGVLVRQADVPSLAAHLRAHYARREPDHLLFEWFSGERADTRCAARPPTPCRAAPRLPAPPRHGR